jgi:hypothetical protein
MAMAFSRMKMFVLAALGFTGLLLPSACMTELDLLGADGMGGELGSGEAAPASATGGGFGGTTPKPDGGIPVEAGDEQVDAPFEADALPDGGA